MQDSEFDVGFISSPKEHLMFLLEPTFAQKSSKKVTRKRQREKCILEEREGAEEEREMSIQSALQRWSRSKPVSGQVVIQFDLGFVRSTKLNLSFTEDTQFHLHWLGFQESQHFP